MSSQTFERLRVPIVLGLVLMLIAGYLLLRRVDADSGAPGPTSTIVVGVPGGGVVPVSPTESASPSVEPSPTATPSAAPTPTIAPTALPEDFVANVLACRSISGAECNDEIDRLRGDDETFVALVLFDNARAGDVLNVILDGPSGPVEGGAYALPGSGRGYYYSTFAVAGLPPGEYTLTALHNGDEVARTGLRKSGNDN